MSGYSGVAAEAVFAGEVDRHIAQVSRAQRDHLSRGDRNVPPYPADQVSALHRQGMGPALDTMLLREMAITLRCLAAEVVALRDDLARKEGSE